uniref:Uncharacterized protein n=1 Tax=Timema poppense TaxID=170557 RepID=A0A7R9D0U8_TIMPO|nr:unnamed protein product [Timema poppensis]
MCIVLRINDIESTPDRDLNLSDLLVINSLVCSKSNILDHVATEAGRLLFSRTAVDLAIEQERLRQTVSLCVGVVSLTAPLRSGFLQSPRVYLSAVLWRIFVGPEQHAELRPSRHSRDDRDKQTFSSWFDVHQPFVNCDKALEIGSE